MAYLTKEQYERRSWNAGKRTLDNQTLAVENGMTEEQAEFIGELCSLRHELHCNIDHLVSGPDCDIARSLVLLNKKIKESGIKHMTFIPSEHDDYIDIDDIYSMGEWCDDIPDRDEDEEAYREWYNTTYEDLYEQWSDIHTKIEEYLKDIDEKYGTSFCPTGAQRIF